MATTTGGGHRISHTRSSGRVQRPTADRGDTTHGPAISDTEFLC